MFGRNVGWLARSIKSKEWIDDTNKKRREQGREDKYLRWQNSVDTDFLKILFGFDELIYNITQIVIVVEGVTSKANIDKLLRLWEVKEIKCVCTFGKKISPEQINLLRYKGIRNVILLYDQDAVNETKEHSFELEKFFKVDIGFIPFKNDKGENKDPGDINSNELEIVMKDLKSPIQFYVSKIKEIKLS